MVEPFTVFYAWQSDLPGRTNRGLIREALERAAKNVNREVELEIRVDMDTQGLAGAVHIADSIFEKIRQSDAFVADVSLVTGTERRSPNPNVLIELGYAAHALGWDRIVAVCNTAVGSIEELPFDIRGRRVASYSLDPESDDKPGEPRGVLVKTLEFALRTILEVHDASARRPRTASQALVEGIVAGSPGRRVLAAEYMNVFDTELALLRPPSTPAAEVLIEALNASTELVRGFHGVAKHIALMKDEEVLELVIRGLEPLANRCRASPREGSSRCNSTDADFEFFTGQELILILMAELIGMEAWELAERVAGSTFYVTNTRTGESKQAGVRRFRNPVDKLKSHFGAGHDSPAGKMMKERHGPGAVLGEHGAFALLANADALLALRAVVRQDRSWWPLTAPYWDGIPRFLIEAQSRAKLKQLERFLGASSKEEVGEAVRVLEAQINRSVDLDFQGLEFFNADSLGSTD